MHKDDLSPFNPNNRALKQTKGQKRTVHSAFDRKQLCALRDGDHEAFSEIYLKTIDPMIDFLDLLLHSRHQAEEISQQIFVNIWENRARIDPDGNFKGYLYIVARSAAFKYLAHKKVHDKYVNFRLSLDPDLGYAPDELLIDNELALLISLSLEAMPEQRRRVFEMSRYDNMTNDEIAARLNISKNTVRSHLYNALRELKELTTVFLVFFMHH